MSLFAPWLVPLAILPAIACAWLLSRRALPAGEGRFATIDGLRGYLALGVYLHHATIWHAYLRTGAWVAPASSLLNHLGRSSVGLFFMITAFLFTDRILASAPGEIRWGRFFVARALRLTPMYLLAVLAMFVCVSLLAHPASSVSIPSTVSRTIKWIGFTAWGGASLLGFKETSTVLAGVTWSLPYEWCFYLCLPLFALLKGRRPPKTAWIAPSLVVLLWLLTERPLAFPFAWFLGGIAAAFLLRVPRFVRLARHRLVALWVVACLAGCVAWSGNNEQVVPLVLLCGAFLPIACGCDLFGFLRLPVSRCLGEPTYSMYLLHGLLLTVVFRLLLGTAAVRAMAPLEYWGLIAVLSVPLFLLSRATWRWIEVPAMASVDRVCERLRIAHRA